MNEIIYKWYQNGTYLSVNTFSLWIVQLKYFVQKDEERRKIGQGNIWEKVRFHNNTFDEQWWTPVQFAIIVCLLPIFSLVIRVADSFIKNVQFSIETF